MKFLKELDKYLNFGFSRKYGYLSSNPAYVGLGIHIKFELIIPNDCIEQFKKNISCLSQMFPCIEVVENVASSSSNSSSNRWLIKLNKSFGINEIDLIKMIESAVKTLVQLLSTKNILKGTSWLKQVSLEECLNAKWAFNEECYSLYRDQFRNVRKFRGQLLNYVRC